MINSFVFLAIHSWNDESKPPIKAIELVLRRNAQMISSKSPIKSKSIISQNIAKIILLN
jgi:hypothetical protein